MKKLFYIGTYSVRGSKGLYACTADTTTGALSPLPDPLPDDLLFNTTFATCRGEWLYAIGESGTGSPRTGVLCGFHMDRQTGSLSGMKTVSCGKGSPCHVLVFDGGRRLAVSQYKTGELYVIGLAPDGTPGSVEAVFRTEGHGPMADRQEGPHIHSALESPDGSTLLAADLGLDRIFTYAILPAAVRPIEALVCPPGSGPRHMAMSADSRFLWVVGELDSTIMGFRFDGSGYRLFGHWPLLPPGFSGESWAAEIRLHPNGRWLYATNRGADDVVVMELQADGTPVVTGRAPTGSWPRGMILSPDGRFLYAGAQHGDRIDVFAINPETGLLTKQSSLAGIPSPVGFAFAD
jgi:6-phosphogluconolactonase